MTWRDLQTTLGKTELDQIVGGFGLEAGLDESGLTLDSHVHYCRGLQRIIYSLEQDGKNGRGQRPELLKQLRSI